MADTGLRLGSERRVEFFRRGQATAQRRWQRAGESPFGYADGLTQASQRIFGYYPVLAFAQNQTDGGLVSGVAQEVIGGG